MPWCSSRPVLRCRVTFTLEENRFVYLSSSEDNSPSRRHSHRHKTRRTSPSSHSRPSPLPSLQEKNFKQTYKFIKKLPSDYRHHLKLCQSRPLLQNWFQKSSEHRKHRTFDKKKLDCKEKLTILRKFQQETSEETSAGSLASEFRLFLAQQKLKPFSRLSSRIHLKEELPQVSILSLSAQRSHSNWNITTKYHCWNTTPALALLTGQLIGSKIDF